MAGIPDLVKLVADLATYEARVAEGKTSPNTIYLVLAERKVFFQGKDWTAGGGGDIDVSSLATKAEVIDDEEVVTVALNDLNLRHEKLRRSLYDYASIERLNAEIVRLTQIILDNEEVVAKAFVALENRLNLLENNSVQ